MNLGVLVRTEYGYAKVPSGCSDINALSLRLLLGN
jgi:hypothetical protein